VVKYAANNNGSDPSVFASSFGDFSMHCLLYFDGSDTKLYQVFVHA